jgi:hypothetical protein
MDGETRTVAASTPGDELADLLAAGERATFHGQPGSALDALTRAGELAAGGSRWAEATAARWLLGVAQAASGRFGTALATLGEVTGPLDDAARGDSVVAEQRLFGALAAATAASVHRQLGRHRPARELDQLGLDACDGHAGLDEAVFDCHLGLASDAVGLAEPDVAGQQVELAAALLEAHADWWRQRVRLDWVRAEVDLLADDATAAQVAAAAAVERAEAVRAPRHVAKGLLFLGVAQAQGGHRQALSTLRRAAVLAEQLGAVPLVWRARALVGALLATDDPTESAHSLHAARAAVLTIADDLSGDLREEWLSRPDVEVLLSL